MSAHRNGFLEGQPLEFGQAPAALAQLPSGQRAGEAAGHGVEDVVQEPRESAQRPLVGHLTLLAGHPVATSKHWVMLSATQRPPAHSVGLEAGHAKGVQKRRDRQAPSRHSCVPEGHEPAAASKH